MTQNVKEQERINSISNALWFKFAVDLLSRKADNNLTSIYENSEDLLYFSMPISELLDMCNDLRGNDRSNIPHYLRKMFICSAHDLQSWLDYLKDRDILSDGEAEHLYNDYKSLVGETDR